MVFNPTIYRNFIDDETQILFKNYAQDLYNTKQLGENTVGPHRYALGFKKIELLPPLLKNMFFNIAEKLNFNNDSLDPALGVIISVIEPGGFIHPHIDKYNVSKNVYYEGKKNIRFNIMIERDDDVSYNPIIKNKMFNIRIKDAWCFDASSDIHKTDIIKGSKNRIVYQFGFCVEI